MRQKNCKKCCVVNIGSYIELAFSDKVAEDWRVRLRCRQGGRHIDEANQSNVAGELIAKSVAWWLLGITLNEHFRIRLRKIGM